MNDCSTCKYERSLMYCLQGHVRRIKYSDEGGLKAIGHEPIENCHGWKEEEKCQCEVWLLRNFSASGIFDMTCKKCGRKLT